MSLNLIFFHLTSHLKVVLSIISSSPLLPPPLFQTFCVCWQLYKELSQCYQALTSSEASLRQSHQELNNLLAQKDQQILQLQAQLQQQQQQQQQQEQIRLQQQQGQLTGLHPSPNRQTNLKVKITILILNHLPYRGPLFVKFIKCIAVLRR